jgi:3D (Asp-Asp-Asp) domain-containing protein
MKLGQRLLQPVWLPVQLAAIGVCLHSVVQPPSRPGWERTIHAQAARSAAISLSSILPGEADADATAARPLKVCLPADRCATAEPQQPAGDEPHRVLFLVTAYCPCEKCCGRWAHDHRTASGQSIYVNRGRFVAADTRVVPFHTRVRIPGYAGGRAVPVLDRGGKIKGRRLDVFFSSHEQAKRWGRRWLICEVLD